MELGTGRSTTAQELDGFSVDYDRTRAGSARGARHHRQGVDRRDPRIRRQADQGSAAARGAQADPEAASADVDGVRRARQLPDGGRSRPGRAQLQPQLGAGAEVDGGLPQGVRQSHRSGPQGAQRGVRRRWSSAMLRRTRKTRRSASRARAGSCTTSPSCSSR